MGRGSGGNSGEGSLVNILGMLLAERQRPALLHGVLKISWDDIGRVWGEEKFVRWLLGRFNQA